VTLHSYAGMGLATDPKEKLLEYLLGYRGQRAAGRWNETKVIILPPCWSNKVVQVLIVDEVSMLSKAFFEKVSR
jgi:hypothetical protein